MKFIKMHGAGNDYVYIDCFRQTVEDPENLAREISDRNFGVGGDGMILIEPSKQADVKMRIFNADGSEAEMCGNGVRCVAKYAFDHGLVDRTEITIETGAGILPLTMYPNEREHIDKVKVNMGLPRLTRAELPMTGPADEQVINMDLQVLDRTFQITCVSMGNPHCVIFVDDVASFPVKRYGYAIENHALFPGASTWNLSKSSRPVKSASVPGSAEPARRWPAAPDPQRSLSPAYSPVVPRAGCSTT
jgi:diaminopimelate epimerase